MTDTQDDDYLDNDYRAAGKAIPMSTHAGLCRPPLTAAELLDRYSQGFYPEGYTDDGQLIWKSPEWRAIMPIESYHIPKHARRAARRSDFEVKVSSDFEQVIRSCSRRRKTWISEEIVQAYCDLHRRGHAQSIEAWHGSVLAGGVYGVTIGGAWFAESMFHTESNASKVAVVAELQIVRDYNFKLADSQTISPFIQQFGAYLIPRSEFLHLLSAALRSEAGWPAANSVITLDI